MARVYVLDGNDVIAAVTGTTLPACWEALAEELNTMAGVEGEDRIAAQEVHAYYEGMGFTVSVQA